MIVVDVEGTGTESTLHSIVSVGALDISHPERRLYEECRIWNGAKTEEEAFKINGFTFKEATDPHKQPEADLVHKFLEFALGCEERTLAGQNPSYDRDFLRAAAMRAGHTAWPLAYRTIDTHTLCYMHMVKRGLTPPIDPVKKHSSLNLDAVMNYCGIPDEPDPHNALTGALSHAEVISRLLYDKKLLPEFERYLIPWQSE